MLQLNSFEDVVVVDIVYLFLLR